MDRNQEWIRKTGARKITSAISEGNAAMSYLGARPMRGDMYLTPKGEKYIFNGFSFENMDTRESATTPITVDDLIDTLNTLENKWK